MHRATPTTGAQLLTARGGMQLRPIAGSPQAIGCAAGGVGGSPNRAGQAQAQWASLVPRGTARAPPTSCKDSSGGGASGGGGGASSGGASGGGVSSRWRRRQQPPAAVGAAAPGRSDAAVQVSPCVHSAVQQRKTVTTQQKARIRRKTGKAQPAARFPSTGQSVGACRSSLLAAPHGFFELLGAFKADLKR